MFSCFLALVVLSIDIKLICCLAQRIEPYAIGNASRLNGHTESKPLSGGNLSLLNENAAKSLGRLSVSQCSDSLVKETKSLGRLSVSQNSDPTKEPKVIACRQLFNLYCF